MVNMVKLQIGRQGLTPEFIENLKKIGEKVENIRINLLKSSGRDKEKTKELADKIIKELGNKYTAKIIGFTIVLKKWRKSRTLE